MSHPRATLARDNADEFKVTGEGVMTVTVDPKEFGRRVRAQREHLELGVYDLASKLGVEPDLINLVEAGEAGFPFVTLVAAAELFGIHPGDLLNDNPVSGMTMAARHPTDGTAPIPQRVGDDAEVIARVLRTLELTETATFAAARLRDANRFVSATSDGTALALEARERFGLGSEPVGPLTEFASRIEDIFGIPVIRRGFAEDFDGLTARHETRLFILVNAARSKVEGRQRFTLAHELAHVLVGDVDGGIHYDLNVTDERNNPNEVRANAFAAEFLVPTSVIRACLADFDDLTTAVRFAGRYGVTNHMLSNRLNKLRLGSPDIVDALKTGTFATLAAQTGNHALVTREWLDTDTSELTPKLFAALQTAFETGAIGSRAFEALAGYTPDEPDPELAD